MFSFICAGSVSQKEESEEEERTRPESPLCDLERFILRNLECRLAFFTDIDLLSEPQELSLSSLSETSDQEMVGNANA